MNNVLWYLLCGTRGGETRARILFALKQKPMNANQLAQALSLDYKTVQHHVRLLLDNTVITAVNKGKYGALYFVGDELNASWSDFGSIWERFGKR